MESIDRYLKTVKRHLPGGQPDDVVAELSESLLSEMESREDVLGRPLDEAEQAAILERFGDPVMVAARYGSDSRSLTFGRQLIGPEWFPFYWRVLWVSLTVGVVALGLTAYALGRPLSIAAVLVTLAAESCVVTLVFALIDSGHRRSRRPQRVLDLYLDAVRQGLLAPQADDIIRELRENLRTQLDDEEEARGRPLTQAEQETLLTRHGHPLLVAGRYRGDDSRLILGGPLIGPVLFPLYRTILTLNLGITLLGCLVVALVFGSPGTILPWVPAVLLQILCQVVLVTWIFATIEASATRNPESWIPWSRGTIGETSGQRVSRWGSAFQLVVLAVAILALQGVRDAVHAVVGSVLAGVTLPPAWHYSYVALLALAGAEMVQPAVNLVRPDWTRLPLLARVGGDVIWLAILCLLLAGSALELAPTASDFARKARVVATVNQYLFVSLLLMALFSAGQLAVDVRRLLRHERAAAPAGTVQAAR